MPSVRQRASAELEWRKRRDRAVMESFRRDPIGFNERVLGRKLWSKQEEVCRAVNDHDWTIVPAGRAVGKSWGLAGIVLWYVCSRPNSLAITTGPDHRQVVAVLWKNIKRAIAHNAKLADADPDHPRIRYDFLSNGYGSPQRLVMEAGTDWGAIGFACKSTEGLSGQHETDLMMVIDEASGVLRPIWEAIDGAAADKYIVMGNPIKFDCEFHDKFEKATPYHLVKPPEPGEYTEQFVSVSISSLEHPHAKLEKSPIGAVSAGWLRQQERMHGKNSLWWHCNIAGLFPDKESVRFIQIEHIDKCIDPSILIDDQWIDHPDGTPIIGCDIGGGVGANRSVVLVRNSKRILEIVASEWLGVLEDAREQLAPVVKRLKEKWKVPADRILFDKSGIGRSFGSYMAAIGVEGCRGYFGGGRGGRKYFNRRAANLFAIKDRLDPSRAGHVPFYCGGQSEWPALRQELAEMHGESLEYDEGAVKLAVESKESLMDRLHRSPDVSDALVISFTDVN